MVQVSDNEGNLYDWPDTPEQQEIKIENLQRVQLKPGDVLIVRVPGHIPPTTKAKIASELHSLFPGHHAVILDGGKELSIVGASE